MTPSLSQKRVLIATPVLLIGGTEIHALSFVRVLVEAGYKVGVCCYYEFDNSVVVQFKEAGADVILLHSDRSDGRFGISKIIELIRNLKSIFKEYRPDIVHVQYLAPGLVPIIAARLAGVPTVFATVHIAGSVAYGWKAKFLLRLASRFCTAFFCVSKGVEEFWFGSSQLLNPENPHHSRKHFTIYNAIDIEKITSIIKKVDRKALKASLGINNKPVIGIVGRLALQKGHTILLDAMIEVTKKIPNIVLMIIGEGPERTNLENKAKELGIEHNIRWFGAIPQEDVFKLYSVMDVLVVPSLYEGFGLIAAEAMAAGLPVVGTRIEGLSEIIEDGVSGYLVPPSDSRILTEALIKLLSEPEKAKNMGEKGNEIVAHKFSYQCFEKSILSIYKNYTKI